MRLETGELNTSKVFPSRLLELIERNSLVAKQIDETFEKIFGPPKFNPSQFAVVVTGENHQQFGKIGQWVETCKGFGEEKEKIRFLDGQILTFLAGELAFLDKNIFTKADSKLITEIVSGKEQFLSSCELVIEDIRLFLRCKHIEQKPISAPRLYSLVHEFYCPEEPCFKWFSLLSLDNKLELNKKLAQNVKDLYENRIIREVLRGNLGEALA